PGVGGVSVQLLKWSNNAWSLDTQLRTSTDAGLSAGTFMIIGRPVGTYKLKFGTAANTSFTLYHAGSDPGIDSDAQLGGPNYGQPEPFVLSSEQPIIDRDAGLVTVLPTVRVTAADASANEGGDTGAFKFTRDGDLTQSLLVSFTLAGSATLGGSNDYQLA